MLPCIAAVAIGTFVGTKALKSNAGENSLLMANVEALSQDVEGKVGRTPTPGTQRCYLYDENNKLIEGRKSVCEQAAPLSSACVPDVCMKLH